MTRNILRRPKKGLGSPKFSPGGKRPGEDFFLAIGRLTGWLMAMTSRVIFFSLLSAFFFLSSSQAKDIAVPADSSIQSAIDRAAPGDTVIIGDGRFSENVVVTKPITLKSRNGYDSTVIEARNPSLAAIKLDGVEGAVVSGIAARGSELAGIYLYKAAGCRLFDNLSTGNLAGIYLEYSRNNAISKNVSRENTDGISLRYSDNNRLDGNNADSNSEKGIVLISSNGNVLKENTASSNYWNGITLWSSDNNVVKKNAARNNTYGMVVSYSERNEIAGNITMRRIYYILPIALIYFGIIAYYIEVKFFALFFAASK